MSLTPLFFEFEDKNVLVIGTGSVGIRRARRFLDVGANVSIITHHLEDDVREEFLQKGAKFYADSDRDKLLEECDLVIVATDNHELNREISLKAKDKLVNCASDITLSNIIVPSTFKIGDVTVSLYTGSKSPMMAKELRKKIQSVISDEDVLNIRLQENIRGLLKEKIPSQPKRKEMMKKIKDDEKVQEYLEKGDLEGATSYVQKKLNSI